MSDARRADLIWAGAAIVVTCIAAFIVLQLWNADLHVPFSYGGDGIHNQLLVKGLLDHGWYQTNPDLGAPFGLKLYDFPVVSGDNLQMVLMKVIGIFTSDSAVVVNLFFLLTFPLMALSAFVCTRLLGLSRPAAAGVAVLFALAPFHLIQGEGHLFISAAYAVPIGAYLALRALEERAFDWRRRSTLIWLAVACVIVGSAHVYFAAFTMTLLVVAIIVRLVAGPWRSAATAAVLFVAVGAVVAFNHLPNVIYQAEHGKNQSLVRPPAESERYGLKVAQMILPVEHHRLAPLAKLRQKYDDDGTQLQEGDPQALGTIATLGFIGLFVVALAAVPLMRRRAGPSDLVAGLALFTVAAVVIASVGGFSSAFAYVVTGQLRAWGRIAVFITFFSLVAAALAGEWLARRRSARDAALLLAAVVLIGILDQTNAGSKPSYDAVAAEYRSDGAFVSFIETKLPPGSSVFELPYEPFPEPQPAWIPPAGPYDLGRGYIHSHDLRWSYGLMKGRAGDWEAAAVQLPPAELVRGLVAAGFSGLYVDTKFYADNASHLLAALTREVHARVDLSPNRRLAFVDLRAYARRLKAQHSAGELARLRHNVLKPVGATFDGGFSKQRQTLQGRHYFAQSTAQLLLRNPEAYARRVRLVFRAVPAFPAPATLELTYPDGTSERFELPVSGIRIDRSLTLKPGSSSVVFRVDARPQVDYPDVGQPYYLRVLDPVVVDRAFAPFGPLPADRRAAAWLSPFGGI